MYPLHMQCFLWNTAYCFKRNHGIIFMNNNWDIVPWNQISQVHGIINGVDFHIENIGCILFDNNPFSGAKIVIPVPIHFDPFMSMKLEGKANLPSRLDHPALWVITLSWLQCRGDVWYETRHKCVLTLYMLNFSEGAKTYIYILCHSSALTWHR